jgi:RecJ-like exonuclease
MKTATETVLSYPKSTRIRVISHYDADGISSAGILCTALHREGYDFHATCMRNPFNKGLEHLAQEKNDLIFFSDMGSAQIETIEKINCKSIIFDHHQYLTKEQNDNVIQVNANLYGIDGNYDACGATLCYSFAQMLNKNNTDLVSLALAGAIGDKQHIGGMKGFNKKILNQALKDGFIKEKTRIKLHSNLLFDAIFFSIDPYYPGLSGNKDEVEQLFKKLKIVTNATITDIDTNTFTKLQSYLLFRLISAGCQQNILDIVIRKRYFSEILGCELERFADLLDACGKFGFRGIGLSLCFNNKNIFSEAEEIEKKYKQKILQFLMELEHGKIQEKNAMRYFYSEDTSLGGVVAGIAANYIFDEKKPLFSLARKKDEIHVSCRGNQKLVSEGLDLGCALKQVTSEIGGFGGGHKIAAGATIALDKENEFLQRVNHILASQIG